MTQTAGQILDAQRAALRKLCLLPEEVRQRLAAERLPEAVTAGQLLAVGMGFANGPASSVSTAAVPDSQVGAASGISNMARYVGAAVATALAASIYGAVIANPPEARPARTPSPRDSARRRG